MGCALGDGPPLAAGRDEGVDVLHQHAGAEAAQLAHRLLGSRAREQAGGPAPARQLLERLGRVGGGDDHVGLRAGGDGVGDLGGDVAADGDHAAEGALHVALERALVGGDEVVGHGGAARVGVLDDGHGRLPVAGVGRQLVDQPPGGIAVEEVEVRQRVAAVLDHGVPPARRAGDAVARAALVRVLAVAQHLGALEGEVQRRRQDGGQRGLLGVGVGGAVEVETGVGPPASSQATMAAS